MVVARLRLGWDSNTLATPLQPARHFSHLFQPARRQAHEGFRPRTLSD